MAAWSIKRKLVFALSCLGLLGLAPVLVPDVRMLIVGLMENFYLQRQLEDPAKWLNLMLAYSIRSIVFFAVMLCCTIFWKQIKRITGLKIQRLASIEQRKMLDLKRLTLHIAVAFLIIYSCALGVRIYWLSQKDGLHLDEALSITLAFYNNYMWTTNYELNREYTGKDIKKISLADNNSLKNAFGDVMRLWINNRDPPHTNLYYSFLRLSLVGLKTGDIKPIIIRGGILNIVFFTVSFIAFLFLMMLFFQKSKILVYLATLIGFLSPATISNTLFLRPYQIQETMFIVSCCFLFITIDSKKLHIDQRNIYIDLKSAILLSLVTAFTLLTGYYAIIFIGLFGLYIILINCQTKNYHEIKYYFLILCVSLVLVQIFYLGYFNAFLGSGSYRFVETATTLSDNMFGNLLSSMNAVVSILHRHFFSSELVVLCVLSLIYLLFCVVRKNKIMLQTSALCIFVMAVLFSFIVILIAPYKDLRYIMPVFPFFVFLPALILHSIGKRTATIAVMMLICVCFYIDALDGKNILFLYQNKSDDYHFTKEEDIPVFIIIKGAWWKYADLVPYFGDDQLYYVINSLEDIKLYPHKEFYLIIDRDSEFPDSNSTQLMIKNDFSVSNFAVRKYTQDTE